MRVLVDLHQPSDVEVGIALRGAQPRMPEQLLNRTQIGADPGSCESITVVGSQYGAVAPGTASPLVPQLGSQPWLVAGSGAYL